MSALTCACEKEKSDDLIRLSDGIVSRVQAVAVIRWRIFWARFGYGLLLVVSVVATVAAVTAPAEGANDGGNGTVRR